jgi:hypothetical protein
LLIARGLSFGREHFGFLPGGLSLGFGHGNALAAIAVRETWPKKGVGQKVPMERPDRGLRIRRSLIRVNGPSALGKGH